MPNENPVSVPRRLFLGASAAAAVASSQRPVLGANERVHMAIVGLGGRGRAHVDNYLKLPDARIVAVVDVNQAARERAVAMVKKATGETPKEYVDMRQAFDDKSIDAVSMPLPNHWHSLATIWACQAGKDVYIEKPASHNMFEGRKMVEAARKHKRMVQVGSQSRSMAHKMKAMQLLREGVIGKVYMAKGLCYKRRPSIGRKPDGPVPPGIDWDKFLGPAPMRPFNELRFAYNWHWFWDTGNGDIGNQGVHEMDIARWGLGDLGLPKSVQSYGGKFVYNDMQETPNTQTAMFDYGDAGQIVFEVRGLLSEAEGGVPRRGNNTIGNLFFGSEGTMAVDGSGFSVWKGEKHELAMEEKAAARGDTSPHMQNFLNAVKSRDHKSLTAEVEIGVLSAALCHMANISYRLGGRKLDFDPKADRFTNDNEANKLMTRDYRKPYVVGDKV